jgi:hypothetical protein
MTMPCAVVALASAMHVLAGCLLPPPSSTWTPWAADAAGEAVGAAAAEVVVVGDAVVGATVVGAPVVGAAGEAVGASVPQQGRKNAPKAGQQAPVCPSAAHVGCALQEA